MEHTTTRVMSLPIGPHVTRTPCCSLYSSQTFVPHIRNYRRLSVRHATARRARENQQDPLDASKSVIPQRLGNPGSRPRHQLLHKDVEVIIAPPKEQQEPAEWQQHDVVGLTLLVLLAVDVCYATPAEAANIRDFYVNVVYNPGEETRMLEHHV